MNKHLLGFITASIIVISILSLVILTMAGCNQGKVNKVTFQELSSNPNQYNGKEITLEGFYFLGFEVQVIAERLEFSGFAEGHLVPKGKMIWVEGGISREVYDALYYQSLMGPKERFGKVKIIGKFEYGAKYGHLGAYESQLSLAQVEFLDWSPPVP